MKPAACGTLLGAAWAREQLGSRCSLLPSHGCFLPSDYIDASDMGKATLLAHSPAALGVCRLPPRPQTPKPSDSFPPSWPVGRCHPGLLLQEMGSTPNCATASLWRCPWHPLVPLWPRHAQDAGREAGLCLHGGRSLSVSHMSVPLLVFSSSRSAGGKPSTPTS